MVQEDSQRALLFDLDTAIQRLALVEGSAEVKASGVQPAGVYHNLLRQWAEM